MFVNRERLVDDVGVRDNLGHRDCKIVEFLILRGVRRGVSRTTAILDLWRSDFGLFRRLVGRVPWKGRGI